jgi:prepilin-type N-terminal cleavage/methylation domain-containing protein
MSSKYTKGREIMQRKGFTLAEVLITLSIIGVVAALTIPAITASSNEARAKTSIKKAVSVLNQALTMSVAQDGLTANSVTGTGGTSNTLKNIFQSYLSTLSFDNANNTLTTADGMVYTFWLNGTAGCNSPANNLANAATCLVEVDINGNSGSNVVGNKNNYSDLYYLIIRDNDVIPANANANFTIPAGLRGATKVLTDDVAQDALLN